MTSFGYSIREFRFPEDYEAVVALWQTAGPGVHLGRSDQPEELRKKAEHDPDLFLLAEQDAEVIGAVIGGFDGRRGMIYHLAVAPAQRGCGLGRVLMEEVERRLHAKGCRRAYLMVTADNQEVLSFYARLGWEPMTVTVCGKDLD